MTFSVVSGSKAALPMRSSDNHESLWSQNKCAQCHFCAWYSALWIIVVKLQFYGGKECKPVVISAVDICLYRKSFVFSSDSIRSVNNLLFLKFVSMFKLESPHTC